MAILLNLLASWAAAEAAYPYWLIRAVKNMKETEEMRFWTAAGKPIFIIRKTLARLSRKFLRDSRKILLFLTRYTAEIKKLTAWEITVAQAEPSGPILNPATNSKSRNTLSVPDTATKNRGLLESPVPFKAELMALYSKTKKLPSIQMRI